MLLASLPSFSSDSPYSLERLLSEELNYHEVSPPPDKIVVLLRRFTVIPQAAGSLSYHREVTLRLGVNKYQDLKHTANAVKATSLSQKYCKVLFQ